MSEKDQKQDPRQDSVDLSGLSNLQFTPAWTPSSNQGGADFGRKGGFSKPFGRDGEKRERRGFDKGPRKDGKFERRKFDGGTGKPNFGDNKPPRDFGGKFKKFGGKFDKRRPAPFVPTMEVLFYPDDTPFNKLADIMKASKRTYQLFDIAELVLEKPERFILLAKNLPDKEGNIKQLFCAQPFNLPFDDEAAAKSVALEYYLNELFTKEQIEVEPPKGNFQVVNKCGITGQLLGAPNWHRYGEHLREYHRENCPRVSFEAFTASIESVRDQDQINAWLEQMKVRDVYKLKAPAEGENDTFETREAAMNYISRKMGEELVKAYEQVRMKGSNLNLLPFSRIRKNIEDAWRKQKRFPIITANNLRGRLRRSGFAVYKRGSKGFAFVSVVKRKFLYEGDSLADAPQKIFDFILANPGISAAEMPYKFLGISAPDAHTEKPKTLAEESHAQPAEGEEPKQSEAEAKTAETLAAESKDLIEKLSPVLKELSWLISEGYVVEYADATLQANPYLPRPKEKSKDTDESNIGVADEPVLKAKEPSKTEEEDEDEERAETSEEAEASEEQTPQESPENKTESGEEDAK